MLTCSIVHPDEITNLHATLCAAGIDEHVATELILAEISVQEPTRGTAAPSEQTA